MTAAILTVAAITSFRKSNWKPLKRRAGGCWSSSKRNTLHLQKWRTRKSINTPFAVLFYLRMIIDLDPAGELFFGLTNAGPAREPSNSMGSENLERAYIICIYTLRKGFSIFSVVHLSYILNTLRFSVCSKKKNTDSIFLDVQIEKSGIYLLLAVKGKYRWCI
jgi:hypothetical protein